MTQMSDDAAWALAKLKDAKERLDSICESPSASEWDKERRDIVNEGLDFLTNTPPGPGKVIEHED